MISSGSRQLSKAVSTPSRSRRNGSEETRSVSAEAGTSQKSPQRSPGPPKRLRRSEEAIHGNQARGRGTGGRASPGCLFTLLLQYLSCVWYAHGYGPKALAGTVQRCSAPGAVGRLQHLRRRHGPPTPLIPAYICRASRVVSTWILTRLWRGGTSFTAKSCCLIRLKVA